MVTIAEQIDASLKTVTDWTTPITSFFAQMFKRTDKTAFDTAITKAADDGDWETVAIVKRRAEICEYESSTIIDKTKQFLSNIPMFTSAKLPKRADGYFWPYLHVILNGYKWAKELNHEVDRWGEPNDAFRALYNFRFGQPVFYRCNIDTNTADRMYGGRWHCAGELMGTWLKFYELGAPTAIELGVRDEWYALNYVYWKIDHYTYAPEWQNWELAYGTTFMYVAKAYVSAPLMLAPEIGRVPFDIYARFLKDSWNSPQWGGYNVAVHHWPDNLQRRLDATLGAYYTIHMWYRKLLRAGQENFRKMLLGDGVTKAADALLASELFDSASKRFKGSNDGSVSDEDTCIGCAALFLTSIVPDTGSLAIPIVAEGTGQSVLIELFNPTHFQFDYPNRRIRIPVYAGKLKFQFGNKLTENTFPFDGIYQITFSEDWNRIINVQKVSDLTATYLIPPHVPTIPEALAASLAVILASFPIALFGRGVIKTVKGGA